MNFQPFSAIGAGNVFHLVNHPNRILMKTPDARAVLLQAYWEDNRMYARGSLVPLKADTCVVAMTEGQVVLDVVKVDAVDPRRKFWKAGDQKTVGNGRPAVVNIFAGLYLYHGFGQGNYYSAKGNEIFGSDSSWAREQAREEGLPFVYFDTFHWTSDPDLKSERARAQQEFDDEKRRSAKTVVSAIAETA